MSGNAVTLEVTAPKVAVSSVVAPPRPARPDSAPARPARDKRSEPIAEPAPQQEGRFRLITSVPAWLVSLTVHLTAMLLLALLTVPLTEKSLATFLEAIPTVDEQVEMLQPATLQMVELQTPETEASAISAEELTSSSLVDAGLLGAVASNVAVGDVDLPVATEIGELFAGDGGRAMGSAKGSGSGKEAQFFGVKASGRRFVFIVDSSNSMRNGKFDAAKEELLYAIRRLSKDQAFYVIFFDHDAARMLLPPAKEPELLPVAATSDHINRCEKWVRTVENELRTDPYDAVRFAVEMVPDAIYLLTDGKFTDRGLTERFLRNNNIVDDPIDGRRPKVVIHTICFWQKDGEETLQAIAKDYGGTYRYVAPPPGKGKKKKK